MTDSMQQMALDTLGAYFGYTSFRPGQDRMVDAILAGRDALGVMPTGAGKSICYQVPALMLPGITFVVSPLLSLMEDQTRALLAAGARPSYLNSSLTPAQQNTVRKRAREGRYQLMYVAPERLLEPRFLAFAQEAAAEGGIGVPLVAIDEAHCVSQWGQDFRPAYLQIREFIDSLPQRPIVAAFTATATERVRADIQQMLGLQNPATVVTGFDRKNLYFGCEEMGDKAKTAWVRDYVIAHSSESGIVYCSTRKTVDALAGELAEALGPSGIRVGRYHAGMGNDARRQSQRAFIDDDIQVMVATNAFGMGIDKPNVRYVIHNNVPESIEAYYQEAGRAGAMAIRPAATCCGTATIFACAAFDRPRRCGRRDARRRAARVGAPEPISPAQSDGRLLQHHRLPTRIHAALLWRRGRGRAYGRGRRRRG